MLGFPKPWIWASLWILVPLFFYMSLGCSTLPNLQGKTTVQLTPFLFGYMCSAPDTRFAKEHLRYGYCDTGVWVYNDTEPCVNNVFAACNGGPTLRERENLTAKIMKADKYTGSVLMCVEGYAWLSGHTVRVSECVDGSWTPVFDLCSPACVMDKDCSKIAVNQTEIRIISPDGNTLKAMMAECREHSCGKAQNKPYAWTLIGRRNTTAMDANYSVEVTKNMRAESSGDRLISGKQYFIGTYNLGAMSQDSAGKSLPLILRIEMTVAGQSSPLHITYFGVTFDFEGGVNLTSNYHGNLENCWKGRTVVSLLTNVTQCNLFGENSLFKWGTVTPVTVLMYVTPMQVDQEATCPALNVTDVAWMNVNVTVPLERCPGTVVSFSCIGQYMVEKTTLQASGSAECRSDKTWSTTPQFPCKMKCPDGYNLSVAEDYCFKTPATPLSEGLKSALKICSGLFWIHSQEDFSNVPDDGSFYYTAQVGKEATAVIGNLTQWNKMCNGTSCQITEDTKCLAVSRSKYKIAYCGDSTVKALCRTPAACPANYVPLNSYCYRVINSSTGMSDFLAAAQACSDDTAALAYPETQEQLDFIENLVSASSAQLVNRVQLGIHDVNGNWTVSGLYAPTSDILTAVGTTNATQHWRYLEVSTTSSSSSSSSSVTSTTFIGTHYTGTAGLAVCRYPDDFGTACRTQPRQPTENMKPPNWKSAYAMGDVMSYRCYPGYFFNGNITAPALYNMTCLGRLGEWYSDLEFPRCLAANVCLSDLPALPTVGMVTNETNTSRFLNGSVTFTCPQQMAIANGSKTQNITCMTPNNSTYNFTPSVLQKCYMFCWDALVVKNATTTWLTNSSYMEGSNVTATCISGHQVTPGSAVQTVNCTTNGTWQSMPCYPACVDPPPVPPSVFMTADPSLVNAHGTLLNYTCNPGFFVPVTVENPVVTKIAQVKCNGSGLWETPKVFDCTRMCPDDPLVPPSGVNSSWDGVQRAVNAMVNYTCGLKYHIFSDGTSMKSLTCQMDPTVWTGVNTTQLNCVIGTTTPPVVPVFNVTNATLEARPGPYFENATLTYNCAPKMRTSTGANSTVLTFTGSGWSAVDPNFLCYPEAFSPPTLPEPTAGEKGTLQGPSGPFYVSMQMNYTCPEGSSAAGGKTYFTLTYTINGWEQLDPKFICYKVTYLPPTLPADAYNGGYIEDAPAPYPVGYVLYYTCMPKWINMQENLTAVKVPITYTEKGWSPFNSSSVCTPNPKAPVPPTPPPPPPSSPNANVLDQAYEITATTHMPSLQEFMKNSDPTAPDFALTDGPFGFGYAVSLQSDKGQCLKRSPFATSDDCTQDPNTCKAGFSLSIWERVNISFDVFYTVYKYHQDAKRYVLSTGGDEFGHPGVAIYHQGLALVALVSTGDKYWKLEVLGPFRNNDWNNIGIRWQNSETTTGGLELYIDAIKVGQEHYSKPSAPAKGILNPSEMLIGCHKDADNPTYRGYNVADFDEYAYWNRRLPDDQTIFFMGGYEGNIENLTPEEFAHMLSKTNMKDPIQAQIAMTIFNTMADSLKVDDGSQEPANKTLAGNNNGTVPLDSMSLKLRGMADALNKLANPDLIKNDLNLRELGIYMDIIKAASKILNESNAEKWHKIEDNGHRGAPGVKEDVERYIDALGKKLKMEPNNPEPQSFVKFTDNILVKMEKMSVRDYQMRGNSYVSPRYSESPEMRDFWLDWNTPLEKVTVPMALVGGIPECDDYLVSVSTVVYDTMDDVGPSRVSPKSLNDKVVNKLDSRVIRTNVNVYPPLNSATTSKGVSCYPNAQKLNANPVQFTGGHKELRFTIRHPTFHHTELNTDIYKRHCVWWNSQIGVKGAWDSSGCLLLQTTQFYTKCSCKQFGSFAIMAEHMEERIPPYEPGWLRGIKIFLYIISDVLLLFYILVVVFSGDLKDQFHLSGLLLSGCLVGGSVGMLLSDVESIQHSRHNCTAIGTLIQGFYMLSALWVTMLGHAGFKATTRGIIAGRLQSYAAVSFGVTMVLIGISIAFFIHILGTDPRCFISWFGEAKLVLFFFPVVVCLGVSLFFSCVVLFNVNHSKKLNKVIQTDYSSFIVGSTAVIFYFTITWIIAAFSYVKIGDGYSGMYPIFQILNSLMGVVVFISIGIMSTKFRRVLTRTHQRRGEILQKMKEKAKIATEGKAPKNPKDKAIPPPSPPPSPPPPPPPPPTKNQPKPPSPPPNPSLSPSPPNLIDAD